MLCPRGAGWASSQVPPQNSATTTAMWPKVGTVTCTRLARCWCR